jgi:Cd2+/Zn2+-exporting ATPase
MTHTGIETPGKPSRTAERRVFKVRGMDCAEEAIRQLKELGIKPVVMLTGDNRPTAEAIAAHAGVDEVRAELLAEDKVSVVADLVTQHGMTAMVGDGINDAPKCPRARWSDAATRIGHAGS